MYNFVDFGQKEGQPSSLMSVQTVFKGVSLDNALSDENGSFTTLSVSGRGILSKRIRTFDTPGKNGVREGRYTYDTRNITVRFRIKDKTNEGLRERFNRLNGLLTGSKQVLEFTDEDAYFVATVDGASIPEETSNSVIGTINFYCSDPLKRKKSHEHSVESEFTPVTVEGQEPTPWTASTTFTSASSLYTFEVQGYISVEVPFNFVSGDILTIEYRERSAYLNGNKIGVSFSTEWTELSVGYHQVRASNPTTLTYEERWL